MFKDLMHLLGDGAGWAAERIADILLEAIKLLLKAILWLIMDSSYWICLFAALIALFLYIAGIKKAGKYVGISFLLYYLLQGLKVVIE